MDFVKKPSVSITSHSLPMSGRVKVAFPWVKPRENGFSGTTRRADAVTWMLTEDNGIQIKLHMTSNSARMEDKERLLQRKIAIEIFFRTNDV